MYWSSVVGVKKRRLQTVPSTTFHRVTRNSMEGVKDVRGICVPVRHACETPFAFMVRTEDGARIRRSSVVDTTLLQPT